MVDLTPGSTEWRKIVTASKVAAILGLSPWDSPRSLWHLMRGDIEPPAETDTHRRGHYLEPAILAWWRDRHLDAYPTLDRRQPFFRLGDWAAATPDAVALFTGRIGDEPGGFDRVLVEAKSTAQEWDELPAYYLTQVIWQMHVSGIHRCYVPVIGPRLTFTEYVVDYADYTEDAALIERRCREFYDSLALDTPPELDDSVATYEAIRRVHPDIDRDAALELSRDEADDLITFNRIAKETDASLRLSKATVLDRMGRARLATYQGNTVARRQPGKGGVSFVITGKPEHLTELENTA